MIKLFFRQNDEMGFIDISPKTYKRLKLYLAKNKKSLQQTLDLIHKRYDNISEKIINHYLDLLD